MTFSQTVTQIGKNPSKSQSIEITSKTRKIIGLKYPLGKLPQTKGYFSRETGLSLVKSMLRQALLTEKGERVMLPNFGCGLKRYLFEPLDEKTFLEIKENIVTTITQYVPGVEILKLNITPLDSYGVEGLQALKITLTCKLSELENSLFEFGLDII